MAAKGWIRTMNNTHTQACKHTIADDTSVTDVILTGPAAPEIENGREAQQTSVQK